MKNFVEPIIHTASPWTGSPSTDFISKIAKMNTGYISVTDHGYLKETIKIYTNAKKKKLKSILGIEIYFRDDNCPLAQNTESETLKYFTLAIHCKDQAAFNHLTWVNNNIKRRIVVRDEEFPLWGWEELTEVCRAKVTLMCTNYSSMVAKHLLVNRADVGVKYYERLKYLVPDGDFYCCIIPQVTDRVWKNEVVIKFKGTAGTLRIGANSMIETNYSKMAKGSYLADKNTRHTKLVSFSYNNVLYEVNKEIESAKLEREFTLLTYDLQKKANLFHKGLAHRYGDQLLISNYVYFDEPKNKLVQDMRFGEDFKFSENFGVIGTEESSAYLKEMGLTEEQISILIDTSYIWASKFDNFELNYEFALPECDGDPLELLMEKIKQVGRWNDDPAYVARFKHELETYKDNSMTNLIPYLFPIADVLNHYKENDELVGPGRGSSGASLICYYTGITQLDSIFWDLPFSRYLSTKRINKGDFPDIDVDLPHRDLLVGKDGNSGYMYNRWGSKACQISTRTMMRLKSAIKDVNRYKFGETQEEIEKFATGLDNPPQGMNDRDFVFGYEQDEAHVPGFLEKSEELQEYAVNRPEEWEIVSRCLGIPRQDSRHASAFIIANKDLRHYLPLMEVGGVTRVSQLEAKATEYLKLIKFDFLNIRMLKDMGMCLKLINKKNGVTNYPIGDFDHNGVRTYIWNLPVDHKANEQMWKGRTETTWQTNTTSMLPYVKAIKPGFEAKNLKSVIMDYATILALVRPGPLDFIVKETGLNMAETYVELRFGRLQPDIAVLAEYLPETFGVIVFQEQLTKLANELAEMPTDDAEDLRKLMCKKQKVEMLKLKPSFIEGAAKKVGYETANKVWDRMETFAQYGFSIIHSVEYALITYASVFLKHNYPLEWWTSVLSNADEKEIVDVFWKYVKDMVIPPDINLSTEAMAIDYHKKTIRSKLSMVNGISGEGKAIKAIISGRPYANLEDFTRKKVCGVALAKKLILVGVLDSLFDIDANTETKMYEYDKICKKIAHEEALVNYEEKLKYYDLKVKEWEIAKANGDKAKKPTAPKVPILKTPVVDEIYATMTPVMEFQMKKMIMPSINLDLRKLIAAYPNKVKTWTAQLRDKEVHMLEYFDSWKKAFIECPLVSGDQLKHIDETDFDRDVKVGVAGFIVEAKEFTFHQVKKALKLIIDSDGYIHEKIIWSDRDSGKLVYDEELKEGAVCIFIMEKREGKKFTNIRESYIEYPTMIKKKEKK